MTKDFGMFVLKLVGFTGLLWVVHYYVFFNFFSEIDLYLPLWTIYAFNAVLVLIVFGIINYKVTQRSDKVLSIFLVASMVKMALAVVFLLPVFTDKVTHVKVEVFNFFIPYFLFLFFEIYTLSNFFKNTETK